MKIAHLIMIGVLFSSIFMIAVPSGRTLEIITEDFEGAVAYSQVTLETSKSGMFYTEQSFGWDSGVDDYTYYEGLQAYFLSGVNPVYQTGVFWNFTLSGTITYFSCYFITDTNDVFNISFYNKTYGGPYDPMIKVGQNYHITPNFGWLSSGEEYNGIRNIGFGNWNFLSIDLSNVNPDREIHYTVNTSTVTGDFYNITQYNLGYLIDSIFIWCGDVGNPYGDYVTLDDMVVHFEPDYPEAPEEEGQYITIRFLDGTTNTYINYGQMICFIGPPISGTFRVDVRSDLWEGSLCVGNGEFQFSIPVEGLSFQSGSSHWFNVTGALAYVKSYHYYSQKHTLYNYSEVIIVLYQEGDLPVWENEMIKVYQGLEFGIRADKFRYDYREQVRIQYKLPTVQELYSIGLTKNLEIKGWKALDFWKNTMYLPSGDPFMCQTYSNSWVDAPVFNPMKPSTGQEQINLLLRRVSHDLWLFKIYQDFAIIYIQIYDDETEFIPSGNITSIIPPEPYVGQATTISYEANNNGTIEVLYYASGNPTPVYGPFNYMKPVGEGSITCNPLHIGVYAVNLYVYSGVGEPSLEDTEFFYVNASGDSPGDVGYNIEFLTVMNDRVVAGYDTVRIAYRTVKNNTRLTIDSPKNARNPYSINVTNQSNYNIHSFFVPSWFSIGRWNVTLYGEETLYDYFWVIAEENNYAQFLSKSYYIGETPDIYVRHNLKVNLQMYKDGRPYGSYLFLDEQMMTEGVIQWIESHYFTVGEWELQLWEVNNEIPTRLLSVDTTWFYPAPHTPGDEDFFGFEIGAPFSYFAGVFLVIIFTLSPFLILGMVRKGDFNLSSIPQYLYLVMASIGFITAIILGFFPEWSILVFLVISIMLLMVLWLKGKTVMEGE